MPATSRRVVPLVRDLAWAWPAGRSLCLVPRRSCRGRRSSDGERDLHCTFEPTRPIRRSPLGPESRPSVTPRQRHNAGGHGRFGPVGQRDTGARFARFGRRFGHAHEPLRRQFDGPDRPRRGRSRTPQDGAPGRRTPSAARNRPRTPTPGPADARPARRGSGPIGQDRGSFARPPLAPAAPGSRRSPLPEAGAPGHPPRAPAAVVPSPDMAVGSGEACSDGADWARAAREPAAASSTAAVPDGGGVRRNVSAMRSGMRARTAAAATPIA